MNIITASLLASLAVLSACSSPQDRHEQRQVDARNEYRDDLRQSQQQLEDDELNARRSEAKDMIDESDSVEVDEGDGRIQLDD